MTYMGRLSLPLLLLTGLMNRIKKEITRPGTWPRQKLFSIGISSSCLKRRSTLSSALKAATVRMLLTASPASILAPACAFAISPENPLKNFCCIKQEMNHNQQQVKECSTDFSAPNGTGGHHVKFSTRHVSLRCICNYFLSSFLSLLDETQVCR